MACRRRVRWRAAKGLEAAAGALTAAGGSLSAAAGALSSAAAGLKQAVAAASVPAGSHPLAPAGVSGGRYVPGAGGGGQVVNHVVHVHVAGSVTAEKDLARNLQAVYLNQADRNLRTGLQLPHRGG